MTDRPIVEVSGDDYDMSVTILKNLNEATEIFQHGGRLVRVVPASVIRPPQIEELSADSLRSLIGTKLELQRRVKRGTEVVSVSRSLAMNILNLPTEEWEKCGVRVLEQLRIIPHLTANLRLLSQPGYDAASRTYLQLAETVELDVPQNPSADEIRKATNKLLEPLADFPFVDEASRTAALTLSFEPLVRLAVNGCAPAYVIDATAPGTGKGLLLDTVLGVACTDLPRKEVLPTSDTEVDKRLVASLMAGEMFLLYDNIKHYIDSQSLCALLTSEHYGGRILGQSQHHASKVRVVTALTGNQVRASAEFIRRIVPITLDAAVERPDKREFRIPLLREYVKAHRKELLQAALTIIQGWIAQGRPRIRPGFPSFELWHSIMGGIMTVAGRGDTFLTNRAAYMEKRALDTSEEGEFVEAWFDAHNTTEVTARDLVGLVREQLLLPSLQTGMDASLPARLSLYIGRLDGRIFNGLRVNQCGRNKHRKVNTFRLEVLESRAPDSMPAGSGGEVEGEEENEIF